MNLSIFLLTLTSGILNATWNFLAKKKSRDLAVTIFGIAISYLTALPITIISIIVQGFDLRAIPYILISGSFASLYILLLVKMYESSDLSMAYPITRGTGVMFIAILSPILLNEHISNLAIAGIFLVMLGIFFFSLTRGKKLSEIWESIKGQKFAFATGLSIVGFSLIDRVAINYCNPLCLYTLRGTVAMVLAFPILFRGQNIICSLKKTLKQDLKYVLIIGFGSFFGYVIILMIYSMFSEAKTSYVTPMRETSIVIGAILGFLFLKEKATPNKLIGILAIVLGVILIKLG